MSHESLSEFSTRRWYDRRLIQRGRLRVLHIGNIANNAYNNAKIQRQRGIDADVICHDYYHVMSCPEWEDADFIGDIGDPFYPRWKAVDLQGFQRPRWFVQGPFDLCYAYLEAVKAGRGRQAERLWRALERSRSAWPLLPPALAARAAAKRLWLIQHRWAIVVLDGLRAKVSCGVSSSRRAFRRVNDAVAFPRALLRGLGRAGHAPRRAPGPTIARRIRSASAAHLKGFLIRMRNAFGALSVIGRYSGAGVDGSLRRILRVFGGDRQRDAATDAHVAGFIERYARPENGGSKDRARDDIAPYLSRLDRWRQLFEHYDIVQAYSTDPIIPVLAGFRAFAAYEHGTLREIPFENAPRGWLCAQSYREAPIVFITNADCLHAAARLGIDSARVVCLPHAFDAEKLFRFADSHSELRPPAAGPLVVFSPSRQHWRDNDPSWAKGNDHLIHGFARALARGADCRLVAIAWGRDLEDSKSLIRDLGVADRVTWLSPLKKRELWARYLQSHVVVDQFVLPAIGGVTFEALALGRRVVTALDVPLHARFFGSAPPLLACRGMEEIADAFVQCAEDREDAAGIGAAARTWVERYHGPDRIVGLQLGAYRTLLGEEPPAARHADTSRHQQ